MERAVGVEAGQKEAGKQKRRSGAERHSYRTVSYGGRGETKFRIKFIAQLSFKKAELRRKLFAYFFLEKSRLVNHSGRGHSTSTGCPVVGWIKRSRRAWRHWPARPGTGFFAPYTVSPSRGWPR